MSRGEQPFSEFATIAEVAEQVKGGYILGCPTECPAMIHDRVMAPCFRMAPEQRHGFRALREALLDLGALPAGADDAYERTEKDIRQHTLAANQLRRQSSIAMRRQSSSMFDGVELHDRALLGVSVHHLTTIAPQVYAAAGTLATVKQGVRKLFNSVSAAVVCPRDGMMGAAYVDTLTTDDDVGMSSALLSYTWGYKVASVVNALERWVAKADYQPERTYIWICAYALPCSEPPHLWTSDICCRPLSTFMFVHSEETTRSPRCEPDFPLIGCPVFPLMAVFSV
jgi:hypothetical protein